MKRTTFLAILFTMLGIGFVLAQTNVPGTNVPPVVNGGLPSLSSVPPWLQTLIIPLTFGLIAAIKKYLPKVSSGWYPFIVPFLGAGIDLLTNLFGLWGSQGLVNSALAGAALGGLATWLHQLGKQSGVIPPSPETPSKPA